jgi:hypothetical protein
LALALESLLLANEKYNGGWLSPKTSIIPDWNCSTLVACGNALKAFRDSLFLRYEENKIGLDVFAPSTFPFVEELCEPCAAAAKAADLDARQKIWDLLPSFFGLPEWKDLQDMD